MVKFMLTGPASLVIFPTFSNERLAVKPNYTSWKTEDRSIQMQSNNSIIQYHVIPAKK